MKVLELFSGTQSISKEFRKRGHKTLTLDNNKIFKENTDLCMDVLDLTSDMVIDKLGDPDIIWASPPCTAFSVASISHHWEGGYKAYKPKTEFAKLSQEIVKHTLKLINELNPKFYFIENPRGILRKMPFMQKYPRFTVTYCQYGDSRMKPTDIWTNHPYPQFKPTCSNGDDCHESAPRGSRTGTQGLKNARERAKIPKELCEHIVNISEMSYKEAEEKYYDENIVQESLF